MSVLTTAILITHDKEDVAREAQELCDAAGYEVIHTIKQKWFNRPKYGISSTAVETLCEISEKINPGVIIYDEFLKPAQNYNLAISTHKEILDREALILEIFESRASSTESRLQVRLAQLKYEMSRARERVRLAKMGEQPGFMGIGKFGVDVYFNDVRHRMAYTKAKLQKAGKQRELHRRGRARLGLRTVSLAGYTSAGKTTLFNTMTGETGVVDSKLFTTLTTTTRRITSTKSRVENTEPLLMSDTVGFISKLPTYMIEAFKSTLEELTYADAVVLVIDISDETTNKELDKKFSSCMRTMMELGIKTDRMVYALNKTDLLNKQRILDKVHVLGLEDSKRWIAVSAKTGWNINKLDRIIRDITESHADGMVKRK